MRSLKRSFSVLGSITLLLSACNDPVRLKSNSYTGFEHGVIAAVVSDYSSGYLSIARIQDGQVRKHILSVHSDAVIRYSKLHDKIFVLNRLGRDSVMVIDPRDYSVVTEYSVESGGNIQDMVFLSQTKAYVSLYDRSYLRIIDPRDGSDNGTIDISAYADEDGIPELSRMVLHRYSDGNSVVFVAAQLLDRSNLFQPTGSSLVICIDPVQDRVIDVMKLRFTNPVTAFVKKDQRYYLGCAGRMGRYFALDGGIEMIDPGRSPKEWSVSGTLAREASLGGDIQSFYYDGHDVLYAIVSDEGFRTRFIRYSIKDNKITDVFLETSSSDKGYLNGLLYTGRYQRLAVADRRLPGPKILLMEPGNTRLSMIAFDMGLPVADMVYIP